MTYVDHRRQGMTMTNHMFNGLLIKKYIDTVKSSTHEVSLQGIIINLHMLHIDKS